MTKLYLGVLSGTSMDAIDVAAVCFDGVQPKIHATYSIPLTEEYKQSYLRIINAGRCSLDELGELDQLTGELFATAVNECIRVNGLDKTDIVAIGSHGQTIWHAPKAERPFSLQLGDPHVIANRTGITTIADFRRANMAAGGPGAPLAPIFHKAVFANPTESRCIINIGGFSNISVLEDDKYLGFDCGPGNCLMDYWALTNFNLDYDADGKIAANGTVSAALLKDMLADPYFAAPAPKSTGREYFNAAWLQKKISACEHRNISATDVQATLLALTVTTIANAVKDYAAPNTNVFLCGGGSKNLALRKLLGSQLEREIFTTSDLGIEPDWVEAALFAWFAEQKLGGVFNVTTAPKPRIRI
jgi:anhydro-N-acetylmuramic acid kinase